MDAFNAELQKFLGEIMLGGGSERRDISQEKAYSMYFKISFIATISKV